MEEAGLFFCARPRSILLVGFRRAAQRNSPDLFLVSHSGDGTQ